LGTETTHQRKKNLNLGGEEKKVDVDLNKKGGGSPCGGESGSMGEGNNINRVRCKAGLDRGDSRKEVKGSVLRQGGGGHVAFRPDQTIAKKKRRRPPQTEGEQ